MTDKRRKANLGERNANWKGGESISEEGYVTVPAPERGPGGKRKYQHRVKAKAKRGQVVHHQNGKRSDNSPDNLKRTKNHPKPSGMYWRGI